MLVTYYALMEVSTATVPHGLQLIVDYVNTRDVETDSDALTSPSALSEWLLRHGLLDASPRLAADDLDAATALREALRAVLLSHNAASTPPPAAVAVLDQVAARGQLSVRFGASASAMVTLGARESGVAGALAAILAPAALGASDGTWERVKACAADDCQWAFYDRSRNHSGRWCDMAVCGNRTKVRSYRQRSKPS